MKTKKCKICGRAVILSGWKLESANKSYSSILKNPLYFDNLNCLKKWVELFPHQKLEINKLVDSEPLKVKGYFYV